MSLPHRKSLDLFGLLVLAAMLFFPFLGGVHLFDWDEINFAECAREMVVSGNYLQVQIDFEPFWEKPPFFFWLQALSMQLFGIHEYAARFPNAVAGMLTIGLLYRAGSHLFGRRFGLLWGLLYVGSLLPQLYFKSGIIDPWYNLLIFGGLYGLIRFYWKKGRSTFGKDPSESSLPPYGWLAVGSASLGLAVLTKGPVALLVIGLVVIGYWIGQRLRLFIRPLDALLFGLGALAVSGLWFAVDILSNGPWFVEQFLTYQYRLFSTPDAGHKGFPGYHAVVLLIGCFPASVLAVSRLWKNGEDQSLSRDFMVWMQLLFWIVLILFSIVESKIIHYSSLAYFPITFMAAAYLHQRLQKGQSLPLAGRVGLLVIGGVLALALIALPFVGQHPEWIRPLLARDPFALGNLEAAVAWSGWEALPGIGLLALIIWFFLNSRRTLTHKGLYAFLVGTALLFNLGMLLTIRKVEGYSQRAAIEFFQSLEGEAVYVQPMGYKSYAHLFYTPVPPGNRPESKEKHWLINGPIDKPVYFITKVHKAQQFDAHPDIREIGRKNGFVFFKREVKDLD